MFLRFTENAQTKHWNDRACLYSADAQTENAEKYLPSKGPSMKRASKDIRMKSSPLIIMMLLF
jgi:hypothetical protein